MVRFRPETFRFSLAMVTSEVAFGLFQPGIVEYTTDSDEFSGGNPLGTFGNGPSFAVSVQVENHSVETAVGNVQS
jgi:hypothetical protein